MKLILGKRPFQRQNDNDDIWNQVRDIVRGRLPGIDRIRSQAPLRYTGLSESRLSLVALYYELQRKNA